DNAFKYTPAGGQIRLIVELQNREVVIRVKDTGIGINPEVLPHIFEMYTQAGGSPNTGPVESPSTGLKGLGVGLALVRQLVELHSGSVTVHSEGLQKGSEFVVRLQLGEDAAVAQHEGSTEALSTHTSAEPTRILIVDDYRDAADSLASLLESSG